MSDAMLALSLSLAVAEVVNWIFRVPRPNLNYLAELGGRAEILPTKQLYQSHDADMQTYLEQFSISLNRLGNSRFLHDKHSRPLVAGSF